MAQHYLVDGWKKTEQGQKDIANYPRPSAEDFERRYRIVRKEMADRGIDCLLVYGAGWGNYQANVRWLSNKEEEPWFCYIIVPREGELAMYKTNGNPTHVGCTQLWSVIDNVQAPIASKAMDTICDHLINAGYENGVIGLVRSSNLVDEGIPDRHMDTLRYRLRKATIADATDWFVDLVATKSPEEMTYMEKAAEFNDIGVKALVNAVRPGITDRELKRVAMHAIEDAGGETWPFKNLGSTSMADPFWGLWFVQGNRVIQSGDMVLIEFGAGHMGYTSQSFHTVTLGKPASWVKEMADVGVASYNAICDVLKPGCTADDIVNAADPIYKAGGCEWHIIAHGVGMGIEPPMVLKPDKGFPWPSEWRGKAGQTIMVEQQCVRDHVPGDPRPLWHKKTVMVGDVVAITETGHRKLHKWPVGLIEV